MSQLYVSAPFGNYLNWPGTVRILGTYTLHYRAGCWRRLWRVIRTVRYYWRIRSWVNKLGLPNPGIYSLEEAPEDAILSIHGFNLEEWLELADAAIRLRPAGIEFNLSCPNVAHQAVAEVLPAIRLAIYSGLQVMVKLPPIRWMSLAEPLYAAGVRRFHLCNTIPTPGGGFSGKILKQYSLWAVEEVRARWPEVHILGGGGVTSVADAQDYLNAGADDVSVASMLFNPVNWPKVPKIRDFLALHGRSN